MRKDKGRIEIKTLDRIPYKELKDGLPTAEEINRALRIFISRNSIRSTDSVAVALPGHMALIRFINVPQLATADLSESIIGEAQQKIPFPLNEVIWGFQKIEKQYKPGEEVEVGLFAIKKEIIENYLRDFDDTGLEVDTLTIAPLALFNFVKYEMSLPDNVVVVDIGSDHTDLVIIEGSKFYVREIAFGGNDLSRILMETFSISFEEADDLKHKAGQSTQAEKIFTIMQPVLHDFVAEIQRSLGFYKSQSPGVQFPSLVLLGDGSKLAGLAKYFGQNLGMKVHYLTDIAKIELDRELNLEILQEHLPTFGTAMGLALQGLAVTENQLNLIPEERKGRKNMAKKMPLLIAAAALLFLLIGLMYWDNQKTLKALQEPIDKAGSAIKEIQGRESEAADIYGVSEKNIENILADPSYRPKKGKPPKYKTIRGYEAEVELLSSLFNGRTKHTERMNDIMTVLTTAYPPANNGLIIPCTAARNTEEHPVFKDKSYFQLRDKDGLNDEEIAKRMSLKNNEKLWILRMRVKVKREKDGSEKLTYHLTGAITAHRDQRESYDYINEGLTAELRKKFPTIPAEGTELESKEKFTLYKPAPVFVSQLLPEVQAAANNQVFFRFDLQWQEDLRGERPKNLPENRKNKP
jgi:type IV pilus assembly protein PilM